MFNDEKKRDAEGFCEYHLGETRTIVGPLDYVAALLVTVTEWKNDALRVLRYVASTLTCS